MEAMQDEREFTADYEAPTIPLFETHLRRVSVRDLIYVAGFLYMFLNYQFAQKQMLEAHTVKLEQIDAHLINTDKMIGEEMVPRKEHDAARLQQDQKDAIQAQQLQALQQDFVTYLMKR